MLMRSYRATRWQIFRIVQLANALPYIFAGLDIGIVLSVIGTIVGEFVGTTTGLGRVLLDYNFAFDIAGVFATLVVLSLMGVILHCAPARACSAALSSGSSKTATFRHVVEYEDREIMAEEGQSR